MKPKAEDARKMKYLIELDNQLASNDLNQAELCYADALKESDIGSFYDLRIGCFRRLGDIYLKRQDYIKAAALYNHVLVICNRAFTQDKELRKDIRTQLVSQLAKVENGFLNSKGYSSNRNKFKSKDSYLHKNDLVELRYESENRLEVLGENYPEDKAIQLSRAEVVRTIYNSNAIVIREFIKQLITECKQALGEPPCGYSILGLGSLAREETTPYSDLEFAILISEEEEKNKSYFRDLTMLLHLKVLNLGETIIPAIGIPSLYDPLSEDSLKRWFFDDVTPRGFAFDGNAPHACKTPLGKRNKDGTLLYELIHTPEKMAKFQGKKEDDPDKRYWFDISNQLPGTLVNAVLIDGENSLLDRYKKEMHKILEGITKQVAPKPSKLRQARALQQLEVDMVEFDPHLKDQSVEGKPYLVKQELYRLPGMIIERLALYCGLETSTGWDRIEEMCGLNLITSEDSNNLKIALSIATELRLRTYLKNNGQKENMLLHSKIEERDVEMKEAFYIPDQKMLFAFYYVMLPVQCSIKSFCLDPNNIQVNTFDNSDFAKGIIHKRLMNFLEAEKYLIAAVNEPNPFFDAYNTLGILQTMLAKYDKALENLYKGLSLVKNDINKFATAKLNIGNVYSLQFDYKRAIESYNEALNNLESESLLYVMSNPIQKDIDQVKIQIKHGIGLTHLKFHKFDEAIKYLEGVKTEQLQVNHGNENNFDIALLLNNIGLAYTKLSKFKEAEDSLLHSLKIAQNIYQRNDHPLIIRIYHNLAVMHSQCAEFEESAQYFESNYLLLQSVYGTSYVPEYAALLKDHACMFATRGNVPNAEAKYKQSLKIVEKIYPSDENNPHPQLIESWINLMVVNKTNLDQEYADKLERLVHLPNLNKYHLFMISVNLGSFYVKQAKFKKALEYFSGALKLGKSIYHGHPTIELADLIENIASLEHNISKKLELHTEVLEMRKKIYIENLQHPDIMKSYAYLAWYYYLNGKYELAEKNVLEAKEVKTSLSQTDKITSTYVNNKLEEEVLGIGFEQIEPIRKVCLDLYVLNYGFYSMFLERRVLYIIPPQTHNKSFMFNLDQIIDSVFFMTNIRSKYKIEVAIPDHLKQLLLIDYYHDVNPRDLLETFIQDSNQNRIFELIEYCYIDRKLPDKVEEVLKLYIQKRQPCSKKTVKKIKKLLKQCKAQAQQTNKNHKDDDNGDNGDDFTNNKHHNTKSRSAANTTSTSSNASTTHDQLDQNTSSNYSSKRKQKPLQLKLNSEVDVENGTKNFEYAIKSTITSSAKVNQAQAVRGFYSETDVMVLIEALLKEKELVRDKNGQVNKYSKILAPKRTILEENINQSEVKDLAAEISSMESGQQILIPVIMEIPMRHWVTLQICNNDDKFSMQIYDSIGNRYKKELDILRNLLMQQLSVLGKSIETLEAKTSQIQEVGVYCGGYTARLISNLAISESEVNYTDINIWNCQGKTDHYLRNDDLSIVNEFKPHNYQKFGNSDVLSPSECEEKAREASQARSIELEKKKIGIQLEIENLSPAQKTNLVGILKSVLSQLTTISNTEDRAKDFANLLRGFKLDDTILKRFIFQLDERGKLIKTDSQGKVVLSSDPNGDAKLEDDLDVEQIQEILEFAALTIGETKSGESTKNATDKGGLSEASKSGASSRVIANTQEMNDPLEILTNHKDNILKKMQQQGTTSALEKELEQVEQQLQQLNSSSQNFTVNKAIVKYDNVLLNTEIGTNLLKESSRIGGSKVVNLLLELSRDQDIANEILSSVQEQGAEVVLNRLLGIEEKRMPTMQMMVISAGDYPDASLVVRNDHAMPYYKEFSFDKSIIHRYTYQQFYDFRDLKTFSSSMHPLITETQSRKFFGEFTYVNNLFMQVVQPDFDIPQEDMYSSYTITVLPDKFTPSTPKNTWYDGTQCMQALLKNIATTVLDNSYIKHKLINYIYHDELLPINSVINKHYVKLSTIPGIQSVLQKHPSEWTRSDFKKINLVVHPDKSGNNEDFNTVNAFQKQIGDNDRMCQNLLPKLLPAIQTMVYKANIGFKVLDTTVDAGRLIYEPTLPNLKKVTLDSAIIYSMYYGFNSYSSIIGVIDVMQLTIQEEYTDALKQAVTTVGYMALPALLAYTGIPYLGIAYGVGMMAYTGYSAVTNAYSFYQDNSPESALRSIIAYKDLATTLAESPLQQIYDFAKAAKGHEVQINNIALIEEKKALKAKLVEEKGKFGQKLYDYIYEPSLEEKYALLNQLLQGNITEEQ